MRKLYIFGNGLGMGISSDAYNLASVMKSVWDGDFTDAKMRELVVACLPGGATRPTSEDQLATLQDTVSACEVLLGVRNVGGGHWLSTEGREFPDAVHRFSFLVARSMFFAKHQYGSEAGQNCFLPDDFVQPLVDEISASHSHVATLNYDGLLSREFEARGILSGSGQVLFDGFSSKKFDRTNLFRKANFGGWYLHLHGSPLFTDNSKLKPQKLAVSTISRSGKVPQNVGRHIVLTHFQHKPKIIQSSEVLRIYWEFLDMAIDECESVVLFGYSGNDMHLNRLIAQARGGKPVKVVEWLGTGTKGVRGSFWADQLGGAVDLELLEDVLTFRAW